MQRFPLTWNEEGNSGYVYLRDREEKVVRTIELYGDRRFLLDLNENGRVVGIEFLADVPVSVLMSRVHQYATKFRGDVVTDW